VAGPRAWPNRAILARRVLVAIGLINYPLYLRHWPLLSFLRIVEANTLPWRHASIAVLLSGALAAATYRFIEYPIRTGGHIGKKIFVLCLTMTAIGAAGYYTYRAMA
jgi:peptidoglycan/LPS O-acetylase OafA/YrhL